MTPLFHRRQTRISEAQKAREKAEQELARVKAETPAYRDLSNRLRELRERNHFAGAIAATFRGERT